MGTFSVKEESVQIRIRRYGREAVRHAHDHHQLVLPLAGMLEMEIGGNSDRVADLRAAAIPGGRAHSFAGAGKNALIVVDIPSGNRSTGLGGQRASGSRTFWDAALTQPFIKFGPEMVGHLAFLASALRIEPVTGLRAALASEMILDNLARQAGLGGNPLPGPMRKAVSLIEACAAGPLTVGDIAAAAGLSPSRLHVRFRAAMGMSPMRYLAAERVCRGAFLLETTDIPVAVVAQEVGYSDQSAFTRAFRREFGCPPVEYRTCHRRRSFRHRKR